MTVYLPVRHSHCTRARFTILVPCSSELAGSTAWPNVGADSSAVGLYCCAVARRLKSRHPFVPAAQQLISFSDNNNIRAAQWADNQWNAEWADNPTRLRTLIPDTGTHTPRMTLPRRAWVRPNRLRTGVGRFRSCLYKWGMASSASVGRRTNRRPCCPPMSNPSISSWTAWPDGSGRWDNRMAAQHLPRDLMRPSSG